MQKETEQKKTKREREKRLKNKIENANPKFIRIKIENGKFLHT